MKSRNRRNKNKILLGITLTLFLLIGVLSSLILISQKQDNRQQASFTGGALLNFKKVSHAEKNSLVSVPVYLNTQDIELNSLNLKINVTGEIKNLGVKIGNQISVKKVAETVEDKSISLSFTETEIDKGWSTNEDVELLSITFLKSDDGEVWLSFDQKETMAKSSATAGNAITIGDDIVIKIGTIAPTEVKQIQKETAAEDDKKNSKTDRIDNNLLIAMIIGSFLAAATIALNISKNHSRHESYSSHTAY